MSASAIQPGDLAPQFTLFSSDKKEVSLTDYHGKNVVILFFPLAFTGVCTTELCSVRDNLSVYNGLNAVVLGVSVDSVFALDKFRQEQQLNFDLLSDFNSEVCNSYGAMYDTFVFGMKNVARRAAFVVDATGVVRYAEVLESAGDLPNFAAIQETLSQLN